MVPNLGCFFLVPLPDSTSLVHPFLVMPQEVLVAHQLNELGAFPGTPAGVCVSSGHMYLLPWNVCPPRSELHLHDNILSPLGVHGYTEVSDAPLQLHPIDSIPI